ncbi:unnamed protein product [Cunninghamella blakesleeana]
MNTSNDNNKQELQLIKTTDLDSSTQIAVEALYKVANEIGIKNGKWSSYQVALTQNIMTMMDLDIERRELEELSYTIDQRKMTAENELKNMRSLLESMRKDRDENQKIKIEHWQKQIPILKQQIEDETLKLEQLTHDTLNKNNITISEVVDLENQVYKKEKQLDETQRQLDQYSNLPCDMDQASMKAQEKLDLYNDLENKRELLLANISHSLHR